jgi:hypothetical protein
MPLFAWAALIFLLIVVLGGTIVTSRRVRSVWRSARSLDRVLSAAVAHVLALSEVTEQRMATASATAARLDDATARLRRSRARAQILAEALREVSGSLRATRELVPRK